MRLGWRSVRVAGYSMIRALNYNFDFFLKNLLKIEILRVLHATGTSC